MMRTNHAYRQRIITLLTLTAALLLPGILQAATLDQVVATLEQGYQALTDVRADFTQVASIAAMNRGERGSGELFIKKVTGSTGMFRFNYHTPQKQQIISNGRQVWFYLPDERQVLISDVRGVLEDGDGGALNYLTGLGRVSKDFSTSFVGSGRDAQGNYLLELVPRTKSRMISKLRITVQKEAVSRYVKEGKARNPFPIVASVVFDGAGNRTAMEFSSIRANRGLTNAQFTFRIPEGVQVIQQNGSQRN